ncbi:MAG: RidA family protein [bacterium]
MKRIIVPEGCPPSGKAQSEAIETEHFVFFSGQMPTDYASGLAPEAAVSPDLPLCGPPAMVRQTHYMLRRMGKVLKSAGVDFEDLVRIEQFITGRGEAPWYSSARREFMAKAHPTSTRVCAKSLEVPGALIACDGFALKPGGEWTKETHDMDIVPKALTGYPAAQSAGPFVLTPGMIATDYETGIHPDARVDPTFWHQSAIKRQTEYILDTQKRVFTNLGLSLADVVQSTVYLSHMEDLPAFDFVWQSYFPENPPARVIFPCDELAIVGSRIEISSIALRPDGGLERRTIVSDSAPKPLFHEPHAVKTGPYLWLSTQMAADGDGLAREARVNPGLPWYGSPIKSQTRYLLKNVDAICRAAGGSLADVVRSQTLFLDMADLHGAFEVWGDSFPGGPPVNMSAEVSGPMPVPGCRILASLVAYIPE